MKILKNPLVAYALGLVAIYLTVYIIGSAWSAGKGGASITDTLGGAVGLGGEEAGYKAASLG